ncbi:MAG: kelch repeat-containing protein, partial [Limisphaerales bacterium]
MKKYLFGKLSLLQKYYPHRLALLLAAMALMMPLQMKAGGTWKPLAHSAPGGAQYELMSDGTVLGCDGGQNWYRLTPDIHGSYANGTWSQIGQIASMNYSRLYFSSEVLTNGNLYVAGGEYGNGFDHAELYNAQANTWTVIAQPPNNPYYSDWNSDMLPNGDVLQATPGGDDYIYSVSSNVITRTTSDNLNEWQ